MLSGETIHKLKELWRKGLNTDASPQILARSFAIGIFIAFSPFPGAHTLMMIATRLLVSVNIPILFVATSLNNPFTMIPFFTLDYVFGYWLVHAVFGWHPSWTLSLSFLVSGWEVCFASFLIGGMVLGIASGLISYPLALRGFIRYKELRAHMASTRQHHKDQT